MSSPRTPSQRGSNAAQRPTPTSGRSTRSSRSQNQAAGAGGGGTDTTEEQAVRSPSPVAASSNGHASSQNANGGLNTTPTPTRRPAGVGNGHGATPQSRQSNLTGDTTPQRRNAGAGIPNSPAMSGVSSLGLGSLTPRSRVQGSASGRSVDIDLRSPLNYGGATPSRTPGGRSGQHGTPVRHRADINSDRHLRQINMDTGTEDEPQLLIWGTNVSANDFKIKFQNFVRTFKEAEAEEDEMVENFSTNDPLYMQKLHEVHVVEDPILSLNCSHLQQYNAEMYRQLICYPQEVIPTMDMAINEIFTEMYPEQELEHQIQVRPFNAEKTSTMRYLNPEDIDQLVTISGMVIRSSNIMPEMREGFFKCSVCSYGAVAEIDRGKIIEPVLCPHCQTNFSFTLVHNRSVFVDKQMVRLQEDLEDTPVGETPYMATLFAHGNLVNAVNPGDRITVTGIYRAAPFRLNPKMRSVRSVYKTHIDVVHFRKIDTKRLREEEEGKALHLSDERIAQIKELSEKPDIYDRLARALAPSIYEHDDVKKGILLQLFGGTKKDLTNAGRGRFRAEINILLCGDPGTSKSQLLKYVYDLVPRSQYTSGKGSSAVGLTAYITKDPETKQIVLQTGALVLADNGVCCIDEFDKMSDSTRSILHEVMEQQTLSIAKAGIICQLNARTSVLAAANPVESQWNKFKNIIENVHLPHTLLSRFDLIFLILDPQKDSYDRRLAKHMISLYFRNPEERDADILEMDILRDYIAYAKEYVHPRLSGEASHRLMNVYADMRKAGSGKGLISAYPRQLESLIRLSEAHAKVRLSPIVEVVDVEEAWRLHREAVKQSATDPLTGIVDVSILTTGVSSLARKKRLELATVIKQALEKRGKQVTINSQKLYMEIKENSAWMVTREMFEDVLKDLQEEGILTVGTKNNIRLCQL